MKIYMILIIFFILINSVYGFDNIIEFDENEQITITTTVYNTSGKPCFDCSCNVSVYNPRPNESFINFSAYMENKGNGVFISNVYEIVNLSSNNNIYPLIIVCNNSKGFNGGDNRDGVKVNPTMFDYTAGVLILIGVGLALLFGSFKIDNKFFDLKRLSFFSSFAFFLSAMGYGYLIVKKSPQSDGLALIFQTAFVVLIAIVFALVFLYSKHKVVDTVEIIGKGRWDK